MRGPATKALAASMTIGVFGMVPLAPQADSPQPTDDLLALLKEFSTGSSVAAQQVLSDHGRLLDGGTYWTQTDGSVRIGEDESAIRVSIVGAASGRDIGEGLQAHDVAGSDVITIPKSDGVQFVSVIDRGDPLTVSYEFTVPEGASVHLLDGGGAVVGSSPRSPIAVVAAPWAVDAAGTPVATEYSLSGSVLTQVIRPHAEAEFPIIADPYVGGTWLTGYTWEAANRILVEPSALFRVSCAPGNVPCWNIASGWLWGELVPAQNSANAAKLGDSEFTQLWCHAIVVPFKETYNLDTDIPDRGIGGSIDYGCN